MSSLTSTIKNPENEEHGEAIWGCWSRSQTTLCPSSNTTARNIHHGFVEEVLPADRTKKGARARRPFCHECHSYSGHELRWLPQNSYFIRHFFQVERLGLRTQVLSVDQRFHFPPDAHVEVVSPGGCPLGLSARTVRGCDITDDITRVWFDLVESQFRGRRCSTSSWTCSPHLHRGKLSSVFMIVGDGETPVIFESQRLTGVGAAVDSSHGPRHGCSRMGGHPERVLRFLRFSSRICRSPCQVIAWSRPGFSDVIAKEGHLFCKCYFRRYVGPSWCCSTVRLQFSHQTKLYSGPSHSQRSRVWWRHFLLWSRPRWWAWSGGCWLQRLDQLLHWFYVHRFSRLCIQALMGTSITAKMFTIHFFNSVRAFLVMITASTVIPSFGCVET